MKVFKMSHLPEVLWGETACFFKTESLDGITAELENADIGESFKLEVVEMSRGEFENLPEFDGW